MNLGEILRTAFAEIWHHKGRTLLTVVGIALGTFAITVMTSFLDGVVGAVCAADAAADAAAAAAADAGPPRGVPVFAAGGSGGLITVG